MSKSLGKINKCSYCRAVEGLTKLNIGYIMNMPCSKYALLHGPKKT
jgi:hypothetical protein